EIRQGRGRLFQRRMQRGIGRGKARREISEGEQIVRKVKAAVAHFRSIACRKPGSGLSQIAWPHSAEGRIDGGAESGRKFHRAPMPWHGGKGEGVRGGHFCLVCRTKS